ncbi:NAD(P)/FAD-dependent oxidoreductase [Futiania mangrovi]|uniref:FAD-dependent oxidoreductase n=1 Tax=Futiania mangrovi TaxID=2959716 RepID=A0A9J6PH07_9PROT|nr:FAD-dependent oxidoreductase [Futiania mangrovii]MCP1337104.1 FAD-dependent oxidoreductase [Futiania mangrovii]
MSAASANQAIVIGAGIVGVCTALQLRRAGWDTTLIDRAGPGQACSFGNAGIMAGDVVPPVASPGVLWKVPGYLADPDAPLAIRWSYLPKLLPWLFHFVRCSRPELYERNTKAMATLLARAHESYRPLVEAAGARDLLHFCGALQVFETEASFAAGRKDAEFRRSLGADVQELAAHELPQFAPGLAPVLAGGLYRPNVGHIRDPLALTTALHEEFLRCGGRHLSFGVDRLERLRSGRWAVRGTDGAGAAADVEGDSVAVAAGAWSGRLLRGLGLRVALDTERGYHVTLPRAQCDMRIPISSSEGAFYATPMAGGLRIAGTVEMGGLDLPPAVPRRTEAMMRRARRYFPGLDETGASTWMGFRPSMPDSLPVIGPVDEFPGLFLAFGHAHLGMTLGAVTGRLITQAMSGQPTDADLAPFRWDRF